MSDFEEFTFFSTNWNLLKADQYKNKQSGLYAEHIVVFGYDVQGNKVCVHLPGYVETITMKLVESCSGHTISWDESTENGRANMASVHGTINHSIEASSSLVPIQTRTNSDGTTILDYYRVVYGLTSANYQTVGKPFMQFKIPNQNLKKTVKSLICTKGLDVVADDGTRISMKSYLVDDDADLIHKFVVDREINYNVWLTCQAKKTSIDYSINTDYIAKHTTIKRSKEPLPIPVPVVLALDIECMSKTYGFPDKNKISDYIGMISLVHSVFKTGEMQKEIVSIFPLNPIDGVIIHHVRTEKDLLLKFQERLEAVDPLWITGYNIDGFDIPYIVRRFELHHLPLSLSKICGTVVKPLIIQERMNGRFKDGMYLDSHGRNCKDLWKETMGKFQWRNYKLDYTSKMLFGDNEENGKMDIGDYKQIFIAMGNYNPKDPDSVNHVTKIGEYNVQDSVLCIKIFDRYSSHYGDCGMSNAANVSIKTLNTRGQTIRSKNAILRKAKEMSKKGEYKGKGKNGEQMILEMFLRPMGSNNDNFKGGDVSVPITGFHFLAATLDFNSLYPTIMILYNICYTTYIHPEQYEFMDSEEGRKAWGEPFNLQTNPDANWTQHICNDEGETFEYRFVTAKIRKGIIPQVCQELLDVRSAAKKKMNAAPAESLDREMADIEQNSVKVVNNSVYGALKAKGNWAFLPGACVVTFIGRSSKNLVQKLLEDFGNIVVYGDTDSVMFKNPKHKSPEEAYAYAMEMEKVITNLMIPGLRMTMEKMGFIWSLAKKMYIYWGFDINTKDYKFLKNGYPDFLERGVASTKRDRTIFHINMFRTIVYLGMMYARGKDFDTSKSLAEILLGYTWQACIDMYFGARGYIGKKDSPEKVKIYKGMKYSSKVEKKQEYLDEPESWSESISLRRQKFEKIREIERETFSYTSIGERVPVDRNGDQLVVCPYSWEDMDITYKMGSDYALENYHLNLLSQRLQSVGRPITVGERFGCIIIENDLVKKTGAKLYTTLEYQEYMNKWEAYYAGKTTEQPPVMKIDKMHHLEKKMASTIDTLISKGCIEAIEKSNNSRNKKIILQIFRLMYFKFGHTLLQYIKDKQDPISTLLACPDNGIRSEMTMLYNKHIVNRKTIVYSVSDAIMENFIKHMVLRRKLLKSLRVSDKILNDN